MDKGKPGIRKPEILHCHQYSDTSLDIYLKQLWQQLRPLNSLIMSDSGICRRSSLQILSGSVGLNGQPFSRDAWLGSGQDSGWSTQGPSAYEQSWLALCVFSVCQNVTDDLSNQRCLCLCSLLFAQIHLWLCSTHHSQNLFGWGKKVITHNWYLQTEQGGYTNAACLYLVDWYNSQQLFTVWEKNNMFLTDCCLFIFPFLPGQW